MLYALSKADRALVVWFVRIRITLYVAAALLNLGTQNPDLKDLLDAFGVGGGGVAAGWSAGKVTDKASDKLPQEESE